MILCFDLHGRAILYTLDSFANHTFGLDEIKWSRDVAGGGWSPLYFKPSHVGEKYPIEYEQGLGPMTFFLNTLRIL